jgi:hypothetical protein
MIQTPRTGSNGLFSMLIGLVVMAALAPAAGATDRTLVIDLSPFTPFAVGGEVFGASTIEGEVINARLDVRFVSDDPGDWSMAINFHSFPQGGLLGVSSLTEGWSGIGTFDKVVESDALNGTLEIPEGAAFWTWFMSWVGGVEFTPPGGGVGFGPMDGHFEVLTLTLTLASCPNGDPDRPWTDLGGALAGVSGDPALSATGSLCPGEPATLLLENAVPGGSTHLVLGFSALGAPFKGGLMVPQPDVVVLGLPLDGAGSHQLDLTWPGGVPRDITFWFQHWIPDAAGPAGFSASNGLSGTTP